jgi:septal ring factor EnvC (AmiA/AmiB activator)
LLSSLAILSTFAGCAATPNAREDNVFRGAVCLLSGCYEEQNQSKREALQEARIEGGLINQRADEIQLERATLHEEIADAERQLALLEERLQSLQQQIGVEDDALERARRELEKSKARVAATRQPGQTTVALRSAQKGLAASIVQLGKLLDEVEGVGLQ